MNMKENGTGATEQRLVDANLLCDDVERSKHDNPHPQGMIRVNHRNEHDHFMRMILCAPTVDAVEVVRCRECEHYVKLLGEDRRRCSIFSGCYDRPYPTEPEDFCSYGVKKGSAYEK